MSEPKTYMIIGKSNGEFASYGTYVDPIFEDSDAYVKIEVLDEMGLNPNMYNYVLDISDPDNMTITEHSVQIPEDAQNNV